MDDRLLGLDGLRGIAALLVVLFHAVALFGLPLPKSAGYLAVDFFFMLSGYVMARTYEERLSRSWSTLAFLRVRIRRLWPVLAFGMLLGAPVVISQYPDQWPWLLLANLLLIPVTNGYAYPANQPAWSILAEIFANLIHGLLLHRLGAKSLGCIAAACFLFLLALASTRGEIGVGQFTLDIWMIPARVLFPYTIGILLYRWWRDRPPISLPPIVGAGLMCLIAIMPPSAAGDLAFIALACPIIIAAGLRWSPPMPLRLLGEASYPIYAVHFPLMQLARSMPALLLLVPVATVAATLVSRRRATPKSLRPGDQTQ